MKKHVESLFDETQRPIALANQAGALIGDADTPGTMIHQLSGMMQHTIAYPNSKIRIVLNTANLGFEDEMPYEEADKINAHQVNMAALDEIYEMFAVDMDESSLRLIKDDAGHYLSISYRSRVGLKFIEQWHYFPDRDETDFVPDAFNVFVESTAKA